MSIKIDKKARNFLARFIFESDAIEGIIDDSALLKWQLNRRNKLGHVGALLYLESLARDPYCHLGHHDICYVQRLITAEQHRKPGGRRLQQEYIGRYRSIGVSIVQRSGGMIISQKKMPDFWHVPDLMVKWLKEVDTGLLKASRLSRSELIRHFAHWHFQYEQIHPFVDGNGRSGRALVYFLFRRCNLEPFIFTSGDKVETYYRCFEDQKAMAAYFRTRTYTGALKKMSDSLGDD